MTMDGNRGTGAHGGGVSSDASSSEMSPVERLPEKIGPYAVVKYVGRKGMADVYMARLDGPLEFSRTVSLKIVRAALGDDDGLAEELAREAAICSRLNHPAIMRMLDFFEYEKRLVLVLEQAEGASLDELTTALAHRKQRLTDDAILYIAVELAEALAHAHASLGENGKACPVIHGNIHPENVWVPWDGQVKLAGFGLGEILGRAPESVAGTVTNAQGYMSPEQARGERATTRSDVYGLGALLWALLGDTPSRGDGQRPPSISSMRPDLSREIAAAIDAAVEPSAERRKITCHELAKWAAAVVNPERGREVLRESARNVRSMRDTMEPPSVGVSSPNQRTRRRQILSYATFRRPPLVSGSFPVSPSGHGARDVFYSDGAASSGLRIPPPSGLPRDGVETERAPPLPRGSEPTLTPDCTQPGLEKPAGSNFDDETQPYRLRFEFTKGNRAMMLVSALTALLAVATNVLLLQSRTPHAAAPVVATTSAPAIATPTSEAPILAAEPLPAAEPDASRLMPDMGYLRVNNPEDVDVYLNGHYIGPTNRPDVAPCGPRFLRLALPHAGPFPTWLGRGRTIIVQCRASTIASFEVDRR